MVPRGGDAQEVAATLVSRVEVAYQHLGLAKDEPSGRLRTARACADLGDKMRRAPDRVGLVNP